jgi:hypothetical protein
MNDADKIKELYKELVIADERWQNNEKYKERLFELEDIIKTKIKANDNPALLPGLQYVLTILKNEK